MLFDAAVVRRGNISQAVRTLCTDISKLYLSHTQGFEGSSSSKCLWGGSIMGNEPGLNSGTYIRLILSGPVSDNRCVGESVASDYVHFPSS